MSTVIKEDLDSAQRNDLEVYRIQIEAIGGLFLEEGSVERTAARLGIGTRTLARAIRKHPALKAELDRIRALPGFKE